MEFILKLDETLFLLFNKTLANPVFDVVMPFITDADNWTIPLVICWLSLIIFGGKKGRITALLVVFTITLSDQMSSAVIKPLVGRLRPCHPDYFVEGGRFLIGMKRTLSFPSSHAANNAAMAMLFSYQYPRFKWIFISLAFMVGYSRTYVGVHYPFDVLGGFLLGVLCALVIIGLFKAIVKFWKYFKDNRNRVAKAEMLQEDV